MRFRHTYIGRLSPSRLEMATKVFRRDTIVRGHNCLKTFKYCPSKNVRMCVCVCVRARVRACACAMCVHVRVLKVGIVVQ